MAQTNPVQQRQNTEQPFSLAPAIFIPFTGLSQPTAQPLDPTEKLRRIIENLSIQHETVRHNMLYLVSQRAEKLIAIAHAELASLGESSNLGFDAEAEIPGEKDRVREAVEETVRKLRVLARRGARSEDYEVKASDVGAGKGSGVSAGDDRDVTMSGTNHAAQPRTAPVIRKEIAHNLRELINRAVTEIEAYDAHAQNTTSYYKQALERITARSGPSTLGPVPSGGNPSLGSAGGSGGGIFGGGGILSNRHEQSPIDHQALRRMSTDMPAVGIPVTGKGQPARFFENPEEGPRRGSR